MSIVPNHAKLRLQAGGLAIAFNVMQSRTVNVGGMAETCGFDWLFIDTEHNSMDLDTVAQICVAALRTTVTPIVRVPGHERFHAARVLDAGAMGVVVPHVNTPEEARAVVDNCRYPPVGHRSLTGALPQLGFENLPTDEAIRVLNENTLVVVMLETPEAIDNAGAIAAVEGVDALLVGINDLSAEMGLPGQFGHERVEAAFAKVIAAAEKHDKFPGMGGVYDHALMEKYIRMGMRLALGGGDSAFMMAGAKSRSEFLRSIPLT
jgi:2-keto-3-deoxy-L-rhamnonate aldolase RhmA